MLFNSITMVMFRLVEVGLKFQYQSVWECVLQILGHFYRFLGNSHYSIMSEVRLVSRGMTCHLL